MQALREQLEEAKQRMMKYEEDTKLLATRMDEAHQRLKASEEKAAAEAKNEMQALSEKFEEAKQRLDKYEEDTKSLKRQTEKSNQRLKASEEKANAEAKRAEELERHLNEAGGQTKTEKNQADDAQQVV